MGVYVPSTLGCFGVVVFLRVAWIAGQAGPKKTAPFCISRCFRTVIQTFHPNRTTLVLCFFLAADPL